MEVIYLITSETIATVNFLPTEPLRFDRKPYCQFHSYWTILKIHIIPDAIEKYHSLIELRTLCYAFCPTYP